ncbi:YaaC-like Protein [Terribacillus halophilus]|uniref:YaaC-like Protein n=1 Tax=Terribacillus halophilus TaxID=361279 RepID=A0A1G6LZU9_9BACI|nr:YaaC family protein [Terribacillus halophilus]SDC48793.1 YaaC-like Protein [Terribacillus halophilus]
MHDENVSTFFSYLEAEDAALSFLQNSYQYLDIPGAETRSYQNISAFLAYLEHGKSYYSYGKKAPLLMKPVLLFYGMTHFMKASLLLTRPAYPESTADLAHGLSTRKRKKRDYQFSLDEVMLQQRGLFPYFSRYVCRRAFPTVKKVSMGDMLRLIPELQDLLTLQQEKQSLIEVSREKDTILLPDLLLDEFQYTRRRFLEYLQSYSYQVTGQSQLAIQLPDTLWQTAGPLFFNPISQQYYFVQQSHWSGFHECMAHYALSYNLSMICRYEAEWWTDLLHINRRNEYPLIMRFLEVTADKFPTLIGSYMFKHFQDIKKAR